ncbi:hypothetical protein AMTRI_Chr10g224650 [Amborella trichopoda]
MRIFEELHEIALPPATLSPSQMNSSSESSQWISQCHGLWYNIALIIPASLFLLFLLLQARKSLKKLSHGRSYIMIVYYALLWLVAVLNLSWCLLQSWQCAPGKEFAWNLLSLFTASGMLFLEVSLVAFLLQGNHVSGLDALMRTLIISGIIIGVDFFIKAVCIFGFGLPLFIDVNDTVNHQKWGLWVAHRLVLAAVYGFLLFMHHTKWRDRLPARPAFYNYISAMFTLNAVSLLACGLIGVGAGLGFGLYNLVAICYHSLYPPLLYITFLADFFQEEDLHLEDVYYSEMKDAGFFDADWD